jgi:integrase
MSRSRAVFIPNRKARLLDQVREVIRFHHYSLRTEQAYVQWIKRFIFFHGKRHPREMGAVEVAAFLSNLAMDKKVAAATQNQALNALIFLYHQVLQVGLGELGEFARAKRPARLPVVLTKEETAQLLKALKPGTR